MTDYELRSKLNELSDNSLNYNIQCKFDELFDRLEKRLDDLEEIIVQRGYQLDNLTEGVGEIKDSIGELKKDINFVSSVSSCSNRSNISSPSPMNRR